MLRLPYHADLRDLAAVSGRKVILPGEPNPEWLLRQAEIARGLAEMREEARKARARRPAGLLRTVLRLGFGRE
ncbi:MAG: hypothetical protein KJ053_02695 [Dehalococcoidia bacterium]|nr:hypothetical protein [Dehalococcoidia bacterium]